MSAPAPASSALPDACPNCGAPVFGPYCAQCGQETAIGKLTLREFGHEYIQNFVSLEGRLWRTLWLLLRYPGQLTVEFVAGRRRRYVRPLPLYFSTSFVLFLVMAVFPANIVQMDDNDKAPRQRGVVTSDGAKKTGAVRIQPGPPATPASAASLPTLENTVDWPAPVRPLVARIQASSERLKQDPDAGAKRLSAAMLAKLPYAIFALVPMFAAATWLVYKRRRRSYGEHFLFALHLHSFAFLSMVVTYPFGADEVVPPLALAWFAYLVLALRRAFGGRLWPQVPRALLLGLMYSMVLGGVMLVALLLSFLSV